MSFSRIIATLIASALLAACGQGAIPAPTPEPAPASVVAEEKIHLTMWMITSHIEGIDSMIESFQTDNPGVIIEVVGHSNESLQHDLQLSAANDTLPSMWFQWGGAFGGRYVDYGVVKDLTHFAAANNWDQLFSPAALQLTTLHDQLAGIPLSLNILSVYYRRDIFEKLGLTPPTTMSEFHQVTETIAEAGIAPLNVASVPGWHIMRLLEGFIEYYAGPVLHDQLAALDVPWEGNAAIIDAFTTFERYAQSGFFQEGFITAHADDLSKVLYPGHAAMQIEGQWFDGMIAADGRDLSLYGTFPFPVGGTNRMSGFVEIIQFNDDLSDEELEAAVAFVLYYLEPHNVAAFPGNYNLPLPIIGREHEMPQEFTNVSKIMSSAANNGTFTITDQALPPIVTDALFRVQDYLAFGSMTPKDAAAFMQEAIESHFLLAFSDGIF